LLSVNQSLSYLVREAINYFKGELPFSEISITYSILPKEAFNYERRQYSADFLLEYLKRFDNHEKVLGVVDVDIYVEHLNFVFGLAEINGKYALISLFRLNPKLYGIKNDKLFIERIAKEGLHELGHTFGLEHCSNRRCVMSFSNSIAEVDHKLAEFCGKCMQKLKL